MSGRRSASQLCTRRACEPAMHSSPCRRPSSRPADCLLVPIFALSAQGGVGGVDCVPGSQCLAPAAGCVHAEFVGAAAALPVNMCQACGQACTCLLWGTMVLQRHIGTTFSKGSGQPCWSNKHFASALCRAASESPGGHRAVRPRHEVAAAAVEGQGAADAACWGSAGELQVQQPQCQQQQLLQLRWPPPQQPPPIPPLPQWWQRQQQQQQQLQQQTQLWQQQPPVLPPPEVQQQMQQLNQQWQ